MLLVGNGKLITRDDAHMFYKDGAVLIDGKTIKEVGETKDLKGKYPDAEFIDAKGGVIMPAFINAHTHIYSALARVSAGRRESDPAELGKRIMASRNANFKSMHNL